MLIIVGLSVPVFMRMQVNNDLDTSTKTYADVLLRAQSLSLNSEAASSWGVYGTTGQITLYKGNNYATRDTNSDEYYDLAANVTLSGQTDLYFNQISGAPSVVGTVTLINNADSKVISINDKGVISY
jgi:hypothetical protein